MSQGMSLNDYLKLSFVISLQESGDTERLASLPGDLQNDLSQFGHQFQSFEANLNLIHPHLEEVTELSSDTKLTLSQLSSPKVRKSIPGIDKKDDQLASDTLGTPQDYEKTLVDDSMDYLATFPPMIEFQGNNLTQPQINE